jgi:hypothetical protein
MLQVAADDSLHHGLVVVPISWEQPPSMKRTLKWYMTSHSRYYWRPEPLCPEDDDDCEIMGDWQLSNNMTCDLIHEIDLSDFFGVVKHLLVTRGHYRDVWKYYEFDGTKRALKMLRLREYFDFDLEMFEKHRRDAVINEVTGSSPYISNIYGHCANSGLYDFSERGDLKSNILENGPPANDEVLSIAHRMAASIADLHHIDEMGRPTIAHGDAKWNQWLNVDGEYQLIDFNKAQLLTWSRKTKSTIPYRYERDTAGRVSIDARCYFIRNLIVSCHCLMSCICLLLCKVESSRGI